MFSIRPRLLSLAIVVLSTGCGTVANLQAPAEPQTGTRMFGPTVCEPFGGVKRSVMVGSAPLVAFGPLGIIPTVVMVGVDAPLSLIGDIATLPVVYSRLNASSVEDQTGKTSPQQSAGDVAGGQRPVSP
jgi:uncharacterized protein YceK